jgi:hypothetical protein
MDILRAPEAAAALVAFVCVGVLLLYCLVSGRLPDAKEMSLRLVFTILLFCVCSVLAR